MKTATKNNFHLTYCTNIHPGEEWNQVFANLREYIPALKARLAPETPFGIGLRLANTATEELLAVNLPEFQSWLKHEDLYVFTLNGFPYGGFHQQVVKDQVYRPDWSTTERLIYTLKLVNILAELLPNDIDGSISTLPLSYKPWFQGNQVLQRSVFQSASLHLAKVVALMVSIQSTTGKLIHLDLEPEPDGLIENSAEVIEFFQKYLLPVAGGYLAQELGISQSTAESYLLNHIRICYDTCHFAVEYEEPVTAFKNFQAAGIKVGKVQISAALKVNLPQDNHQRQILKEKLSFFAQSVYLHQTIERLDNGTLRHYHDLSPALLNLDNDRACELRTHFHVPIFLRDYQLLESTQDHIIQVLDFLQNHPLCQHLEIETYTWSVLPSDMKLDLLTSIQTEYEWVLNHLDRLNYA